MIGTPKECKRMGTSDLLRNILV